MIFSKKTFKESNYKANNSLKKNGFYRWMYVFNAVNSTSGEERNFFIELYILNRAQNPSSMNFQKSERTEIDAQNLQAALAGTLEQKNVLRASSTYCCARAGILGKTPRRLCRYFFSDEFEWKKKPFAIKAGTCFFSDNELYGRLCVTEKERMRHFAKESDSGKMEWNLKYERTFYSAPVSSKKFKSWFCAGIAVRFTGKIIFDGNEYIVNPDNSFGFVDKTCGIFMPQPFLHISSSRLTSVFTGNIMKGAGFALECDLDGNVSLFAKFGQKEYSFGKRKKIKKFLSNWNCARTSSNSDGEILHWSVSLDCKKYVLDIDVFSNAAELIVKEYEMPYCCSALKVLSGASAQGEIRIYKRVRKFLELIEHTKILGALSEYGVLDSIENSQ